MFIASMNIKRVFAVMRPKIPSRSPGSKVRMGGEQVPVQEMHIRFGSVEASTLRLKLAKHMFMECEERLEAEKIHLVKRVVNDAFISKHTENKSDGAVFCALTTTG